MGPVGMDGANGVRAARCGGLARVGDGGRTLWAGGGGLRAERARRGGEWWGSGGRNEGEECRGGGKWGGGRRDLDPVLQAGGTRRCGDRWGWMGPMA